MVLLAEMFDRHMRAIGILTVRWSEVDRLLYDLLKDRLCLPNQAEKLRTCNAGRIRLTFFKARLGEAKLQPKEASSLTQAVDQLTSLYEERNSIVHGQYGIGFSDDGDMFVTWSDIKLSTRKDKVPSPDYLEPWPVKEDDLLQHADAVYEASRPLFRFLHHHS